MNSPVPAALTTTQKLDELFKPWNRSDIPGAVVGIAHKGGVIYRRGFGLASVEHGVTNTPGMRMRIGSTTKHFCALGIMLLAEDGKLDINQPVRTYLPELSDVCGEPTLLQLMQHTGGLRDPMMAAFIINRGTYGHIPDGASLQLMARFKERNFAPGMRMAYSNSGYTLLSLVIERLSGMSMEAFLQQRMFAVLGMHDTALLRSDQILVPNMATAHIPKADGSWRRGIYPTDELLGSGGVISTVDDMLIWIAHLRAPHADKKIGSAATWAKMLERPLNLSGQSAIYGLGVMRENYRGVEIIHHAGATVGFQCQMLTVPEHELDIIVMTNRMDVPAPALALKIVDGVLESAGLAAPRIPPAATDFPAVPGRWYSAQSRTLMEIAARKLKPEWPEILLLSTYNAPLGALYRSDAGLALAEGPVSSIEIRQLPQGETPATALDVHIHGDLERFERLPGTAPSAADLAPALCGRYRFAEFGTEVEILIKDGKLQLDLLPEFGLARWEIEPLSADVLGCGIFHTVPPMPLPNLATIVVDRQDDKVSGFWISNDRTRNIRFDRVG
ncbi:MAG: beta-lactamase family protein [Pseudomonadota bacterium]|nr:beta-lactamase family protein [Pseudomonadota bacterium]